MSEEINKAEETKVEEESLAAEETRMISDEARWYVVHTYSGYENKVKAKRQWKTEGCRIRFSRSAYPCRTLLR